MKAEIKTYDGVGFMVRGDAIIVVYHSPAKLHRSRWLFDLADRAVAENSGGIVGLMVILPTADPPDGPTRAENSIRMKKLAPSLRRFVTVAIGDDFRVSVVRTVMRAISVLQGKAKVHLVANTVEEGIKRMLEAAGPTTPGPVQLTQDVHALYRALGWTSDTSEQPSLR